MGSDPDDLLGYNWSEKAAIRRLFFPATWICLLGSRSLPSFVSPSIHFLIPLACVLLRPLPASNSALQQLYIIWKLAVRMKKLAGQRCGQRCSQTVFGYLPQEFFYCYTFQSNLPWNPSQRADTHLPLTISVTPNKAEAILKRGYRREITRVVVALTIWDREHVELDDSKDGEGTIRLRPSDHISSTAIPIDPGQVVAIIESPKLDNTGSNAPKNDELGDCKQVASSPEIIRRMGIKAMLVDISGHANSTNAPGSYTPLVCIFGYANSLNALGLRMLNWLGGPGSADF
ncbi:hypothetical protein GYMLUDRAFT_250002 [Collybiopsis luxurians FD-317 M1]|uniref:Uncharacterized protein n=1 Tax=Collybiopsis luxurians FD-317 M1 TaxID=944289 RepID=A0A0D0ATK6_9AGAR|nr:hypothetical protein GYMLUDRAFT_250002 [Collybiopsis luxurians FD-317 M1]